MANISFDESPFESVAQIGKIDANGFLRVKIRAAKIGVLPYLCREFSELAGVEDYPPEKKIMVLRDEAALFDSESRESLAGMPLLLRHEVLGPGAGNRPIAGVAGTDPEEVGNVSGEILRDGQYLICGGVITNGPAIKAVQDKDLIEISPSFHRAFRLESGTWNGQEYDGVMSKIRYNHLALLPEGEGRAGGDIAIQQDQKILKRSEKNMADIKIKTKFGNVTTDDAGSEAVEELITASGRSEELLAELEKLKAQIAEEEVKTKTLETERDGALGELQIFKEKVESFEKPEAMASMVSEAVEVQEQAAQMNALDALPEEWKRLPLQELKKQAIIKFYEGVTSDCKVDWDNAGFVEGLWNGLKLIHPVDKKTVPVAAAVTQDIKQPAKELSDHEKLGIVNKE